MKKCTELIEKYVYLLTKAERQMGNCVTRLHSNNGEGYQSLTKFLTEKGIEHELVPVYTPEAKWFGRAPQACKFSKSPKNYASLRYVLGVLGHGHITCCSTVKP